MAHRRADVSRREPYHRQPQSWRHGHIPGDTHTQYSTSRRQLALLCSKQLQQAKEAERPDGPLWFCGSVVLSACDSWTGHAIAAPLQMRRMTNVWPCAGDDGIDRRCGRPLVQGPPACGAGRGGPVRRSDREHPDCPCSVAIRDFMLADGDLLAMLGSTQVRFRPVVQGDADQLQPLMCMDGVRERHRNTGTTACQRLPRAADRASISTSATFCRTARRQSGGVRETWLPAAHVVLCCALFHQSDVFCCVAAEKTYYKYMVHGDSPAPPSFSYQEIMRRRGSMLSFMPAPSAIVASASGHEAAARGTQGDTAVAAAVAAAALVGGGGAEGQEWVEEGATADKLALMLSILDDDTADEVGS